MIRSLKESIGAIRERFIDRDYKIIEKQYGLQEGGGTNEIISAYRLSNFPGGDAFLIGGGLTHRLYEEIKEGSKIYYESNIHECGSSEYIKVKVIGGEVSKEIINAKIFDGKINELGTKPIEKEHRMYAIDEGKTALSVYRIDGGEIYGEIKFTGCGRNSNWKPSSDISGIILEDMGNDIGDIMETYWRVKHGINS